MAEHTSGSDFVLPSLRFVPANELYKLAQRVFVPLCEPFVLVIIKFGRLCSYFLELRVEDHSRLA